MSTPRCARWQFWRLLPLGLSPLLQAFAQITAAFGGAVVGGVMGVVLAGSPPTDEHQRIYYVGASMLGVGLTVQMAAQAWSAHRAAVQERRRAVVEAAAARAHLAELRDEVRALRRELATRDGRRRGLVGWLLGRRRPARGSEQSSGTPV